MTLFSGIHEVVCKRADGKLYIGYFDDEQKALASLSGDSTYQAIWYSLNPLNALPQGLVLNPPTLARSNRSKKDWISCRVRLLIDLDPKRKYGNASDDEKAAAYKQAIAIRDHLQSLGWPQAAICDSGNGYHLIFAIDLPNDQKSEGLIRGVLLALAAKFDTDDTHIDTGNFESNRLCKFPGTWEGKRLLLQSGHIGNHRCSNARKACSQYPYNCSSLWRLVTFRSEPLSTSHKMMA